MPSSSAINEFTGVAGIAPVTTVGANSPARRRRRLLKKSAVSEFVEGVVDSGDEPDRTPASPAAPSAPAPVPAPVAAPAAAAPAPVAPVTPSKEETHSALMITKEVAEALVRGHAVTVRGVLLEPAFSPTTARPLSEGTAPVPSVESAVAAFGLSAPEPGLSESAGGGVDMNAAQPPPTPPSDGRAVSSAFRRFAR